MKKKNKTDLRLEMRAVREGWNIKKSYYDTLPAKMMSFANNEECSPKLRIEATKCLIQMDRANIASKFVDDASDTSLQQKRIQELMETELANSTTSTIDEPIEDVEALPPAVDNGGADTPAVVEAIPEAPAG